MIGLQGGFRVLVLVALALASPALTVAQDRPPVPPVTPPVPTQDPSPMPIEPRPASDPVLPKVETSGNRTISLGLGCGGTADGEGPGTTRFGENCGGSTSAGWLFRRGSFNVGGTASQYYYSGDTSLNQFTFAEGASVNYLLSLRSHFSLYQGVSRGYARQSTNAALLGVRLLAPTALTQDYSAGGSFGYDISHGTQLDASASFSHISVGDGSFDTSQPGVDTASVFSGGSTADARVRVLWQVGKNDWLGMAGGFSAGSYGGAGSSRTESFHASWRRSIGPSFSINAEGGLSAYQIPGQDLGFSPTAALTVLRRLRKGTISVRFEQLIEVYGATHISRVLNPAYSVGFRKITLSFDSTLVSNSFPADARANYKGVIVGAAVRYNLPANLVVSAAYSHWYRKFAIETTTPATFYSNVAIAYVHAWR
jgi:hypothetical protein